MRFTDDCEVEMSNLATYNSDSDNEMTYPYKSQGHQPTEKYSDQTKCRSKTNEINTNEGKCKGKPSKSEEPT